MTSLVKGSIIVLLLLSLAANAQSVVNGDFSSGTTGWGCSPEVNTEATYGGSGSNPVNEVDAAATLCQTISGFVIGNKYYVALDASRRTGGCPGPVVTNVDITVSGGALFTTITRTNTTFGFVTEGFLFTANSATHTITFSAGTGFGGSTCGMIVDNIVVVASVLPIELLNFDGQANDKTVNLFWSTATEKNNDHFEVERSTDGINFENISNLKSKSGNGNSLTRLDYSTQDPDPIEGSAYYRLRQVDLDKTFTLSKLIQVNKSKKQVSEFLIYPNPNNGTFNIDMRGIKNATPVEMSLYNELGSLAHSSSFVSTSDLQSLEITLPRQLKAGYYYCVFVTENSDRYYAKLIVE